MLLTDAAEITGTRMTREGYLVAEARVARIGTQDYAGAEVGRPDRSAITLYRPAEEVFRRDSMASFAHRPVTVGHPPVAVGAPNWKQYAVGQIGDDVTRDGDFIRVPMIVMDGAAIQAIRSGTREISMGYSSDIDFRDGVAPNGKPYQAVQRNIVINHAAIVPKGRAGAECRIGDSRSPIFGIPTFGARKMDLNDAMAASNHPRAAEFRIKAMYALGDIKSGNRNRVEDGIRNLRMIAGNLRMFGDGVYNGGTINDSVRTGTNQAAEFIDGMIMDAERALIGGGIR